MAKLRSSKIKRSGTHGTYTETGRTVVAALSNLGDVIKSVSPGEINPQGGSRQKKIVCVITNDGVELLISGGGFMKATVHTDYPHQFIKQLKEVKKLKGFLVTAREQRPDV